MGNGSRRRLGLSRRLFVRLSTFDLLTFDCCSCASIFSPAAPTTAIGALTGTIVP
ncbi:MAG: hypothetical protein MZV64_23320 [Ignavibacteriales bacterium]|nr:hypothetical protein [Ignavibacteriales bacterium]